MQAHIIAPEDNPTLNDATGHEPFLPIATKIVQDLIDKKVITLIGNYETMEPMQADDPKMQSIILNMTKTIYHGFLFNTNVHLPPTPI